jgi:GNAT superfamily N-acetyltransferase
LPHVSTPPLPRRAAAAPRPPRATPPATITAVTLDVVLPVRLRVLREGTPSDDPTFDGDDDPETVHIAALVDGEVVAVSTWLRRPWPFAPERAAVQLRGMATDASVRGTGIGGLLLEAGVERAFSDGAELVWANARDSALRFYRAHGFHVEGEGFRTTDTQLPHHRIIRRGGRATAPAPTSAARP